MKTAGWSAARYPPQILSATWQLVVIARPVGRKWDSYLGLTGARPSGAGPRARIVRPGRLEGLWGFRFPLGRLAVV
jgi:hypothetical protein